MHQTASTRWCPTAEQLILLEEMYRSGIRNPNASQIRKITAHLSSFGKIEGKNVFYWFQNHKARDKHKLSRRLSRQHHLFLDYYYHFYNLKEASQFPTSQPYQYQQTSAPHRFFNQNPLDQHWKAVKRILRYLKGTATQGIKLKKGKNLSIQGFADADWASICDDRRSTTGHCIFLGGNPVSWCAKKQPTISRSSTESEYRSVASATTEVMWIESLLKELEFGSQHKATIWCDNSSTVALSVNPILHARTKHIEIDLYFVREQVARGKLEVNHLPSTCQIADILTKALSRKYFERLKIKLCIEDMGKEFEQQEETLAATERGK